MMTVAYVGLSHDDVTVCSQGSWSLIRARLLLPMFLGAGPVSGRALDAHPVVDGAWFICAGLHTCDLGYEQNSSILQGS